MVGVGSGSALNAFNIGQAATGQTAIGQAIKGIVDNAEKKGLLEAQSGAQAAGSIATAQFKADQDAKPIEQFTNDPINNKLISLGTRSGDSNFQATPLTENALRLAEDRRFEIEDANKAAAKAAAAQGVVQPDAGVQPAPGSNVQNVGQNPNVNPFNVGGQGLPAPVAQPGASSLRSPEFQGLDPSIFNTPEGRAIIERIIQQKLQAGGGSV